MTAQQPAPAAVAGVADPTDPPPEVTEPGRPAALDKDDQALAGGSDAVDEAAGEGQTEPVGDPAPKEAQTNLD